MYEYIKYVPHYSTVVRLIWHQRPLKEDKASSHSVELSVLSPQKLQLPPKKKRKKHHVYTNKPP